MSYNITQKKVNLLSSEETIFLVVFNSLQIVLGSTANMLEIIFFLRKRWQHNNVSDRLTLNLALADFVALTTYLPWRTYVIYLRRPTQNSKFYTSLFVFCIFNTGNAIILIALDRFIAITRSLRYHALVTGKALWFGVTLAWSTALLLGVGHYLSFKEVLLNIHKNYELFLSCLSFAHMVTMTVIYAVICQAARKQVKDMRLLQTRSREEDHDFSFDFQCKKSVYTTFCIMCLFFATFMPYSVYRMITHFDEDITKTSRRITWRWLMSFTFLNSCLNPYVYFIGMTKFRSALKRLFNIR